MAEANAERGEVNARIVYWGIEGSGKSTNLRTIHAKLRPDHRGRLEQVPTRLDPTVGYDRLPIELGEIAGVRTRIQIVAVPGAGEHAPTRKQLLDRVDGVVFVVDARRERIDENVAAFEELRSALAAYGRTLEQVPLVVQYNKQDLSDPYVLEELHRKLDVRGAAVFEAVASEGAGVLQTLTTISKRVVRTLREKGVVPRASSPARRPSDVASEATRSSGASPQAPEGRAQRAAGERSSSGRAAAQQEAQRGEAERSSSGRAAAQQPLPDLAAAALVAADADPFDARDAAVERAQGLLDVSWHELHADAGASSALREASGWRLVAAGSAELSGPRTLVVPLALADPDGRELRFRLAISLESLLD
jgi:signal recognition particle receptor subunit beta